MKPPLLPPVLNGRRAIVVRHITRGTRLHVDNAAIYTVTRVKYVDGTVMATPPLARAGDEREVFFDARGTACTSSPS